MKWAGHLARLGIERKVYKFVVDKPEGKRPFERPKSKWMYGIRMDLTEIDWEV
jgi:hypothetical protein